MLTAYNNPEIGEYPIVCLNNHGIITIDYGEFIEVTRELVLSAYNRQLEINTEKRPVLIQAPNIRAISSEASPLIENEDLSKLVSAVAVVVRSRVKDFMESVYMPLLNPPYPQKLFVSEEKAIEWLKEHL